MKLEVTFTRMVRNKYQTYMVTSWALPLPRFFMHWQICYLSRFYMIALILVEKCYLFQLLVFEPDTPIYTSSVHIIQVFSE
jgi:hypothetical protein